MDINNLNYFDIESLTSQADLKKAYRKQSKTLHPDSGGDIEQFKKLTEEYDYITNQKLYLEEVRKEALEKAEQSVKTNVSNQQGAHSQSFYNNNPFNGAPKQKKIKVENYDTFADFYKKYHDNIMRDKDGYLFSSSNGQWNKMDFRKRDDGSYYFRHGDKEYVLKKLKEEQEAKKAQEEPIKEAKKKAEDTVKPESKEEPKTENKTESKEEPKTKPETEQKEKPKTESKEEPKTENKTDQYKEKTKQNTSSDKIKPKTNTSKMESKKLENEVSDGLLNKLKNAPNNVKVAGLVAGTVLAVATVGAILNKKEKDEDEPSKQERRNQRIKKKIIKNNEKAESWQNFNNDVANAQAISQFSKGNYAYRL